MRHARLFHVIQPYFIAVVIFTTLAAAAFFIYSSQSGTQWTIILACMLAASTLIEAWFLLRRTMQLTAMKGKLERVRALHSQKERLASEAQSRLRLMDDAMSTMVALVDHDGLCRYHNQSFRNWLHLKPEQIQDRPLREILGIRIYLDLEELVRQSLEGRIVRYERTYIMPHGVTYHLAFEHIPQFDNTGKVSGFFLLANDLTGRSDITSGDRRPSPDISQNAAIQSEQANQELFIDTLAEQVSSQEDASQHIFSALENGEFSLYFQPIAPLGVSPEESKHFEILVRLKEEEQNMMPPGAFFPLAEKYGLMPYLDRWVVQHVLQRATALKQKGAHRQNPIYFINVSRDTLHDPGFPAFLAAALQEHGMAGDELCFEVPNTELVLANTAAAEFINQVSACGCHAALSGFGRDEILFNLIRGFRVKFLKIDGSIILEVLRNPVSLAKVVAITRVAKKIGVKTIAEMVENEETVARLREADVDLVQGFGIARPQPFNNE